MGFERLGNRCRTRRSTRTRTDFQWSTAARGTRRRVACNRPRRAAALDRIAAEALTNHVELIEARVMQRYGAAGTLVHHLDFQAEHVPKLSLERGKVGVDLALVGENELGWA